MKNNASDGRCTPEFKSPAMICAEEIQSNLEPEFPSFAKSLVRSHVRSCFWMGLPGVFCKMHLPRKDTTIALEDEGGHQYYVKYYAHKTGLSAGWRQFCSANNLLEGDVLVFQLVEPTKFKIYTITANDLNEMDGALGLLNLDAHTEQNDAGKLIETGPTDYKSTKRKRPKSLPLASFQKQKKRSGLQRLACDIGQPAELSENDSEEVGSEVLEGFKRPLRTIQFKDVTSFENDVLVDGLVVDPGLSEDIRNTYYQLCCSQNALLHENVIQGISFKFKVEIISETVRIADAIRACKLSTSRDEFDSWDKTLKSFEMLGMNVGFLRTRVHRLVNLAFESEGAAEIRRNNEAKTERAQAENEIRNLEAKLTELKDACKTFGFEIESLQSKVESNELMFEEEVKAPW
ncbi:AP2/B3-like transcriptional factor family protein isoform 3 [Hibiscus syriacus]|uniref:AP2/B3-like transcriptional factor family protein isoform 3 n=1 Tax=Hibiscus syriacus TaxID=106335 RepID=A0A6A2XF71_HIBSY|nr:AP2/B3-like transcriptional factor family protein isoform 3 [Hibiscus syriacus]